MELNLKTQQNKLISLFRVSLMFFLFFFTQQTVASSQSSITLPSNNITIKEAFSEIEKQTGMSVDYDESVINLNKQINASVNNKSLNETLALILKGSGCTFVIRNNHIIISAQAIQQQQKQVTISGTVSDNLGPIAGANVVEKGTTNGIITDMDGNYTLSVPQGAIIQFSYIGYMTKEVTVGNQKSINVQLSEDAQKLDEVTAQLNASIATEKAAKAQYTMAKNGAEREDKMAAAALVERAKGAVAEVESYIKETFLIAQSAGEVSEIFPKVGELVGTGAPIMNIAILKDMWVTFNVREDLLKNLTMGAEFEAFVPALDNKTIKLKVDYMKDLGTYAAWKATKTTGQFDLKTFEVRARPLDKVEGLRPGMSVIIKK